MDVLMAALVAALAVEASDRLPWLVAILADRFEKRGIVILAATLALAAGYALVAIAGALIGARLIPEARQLFLALALLNAGLTAFWPLKQLDRLEGWRIGTFATSLLGTFVLAFGGRTQFIVMALAERGTAPALAVVGATVGALAIVAAAAIAGEGMRRTLPITAVRVAIGVVLSAIGVVLALAGLRLI